MAELRRRWHEAILIILAAAAAAAALRILGDNNARQRLKMTRFLVSGAV